MKTIPDKIKREIEADAPETSDDIYDVRYLISDDEIRAWKLGAQWAIEKYALPLVEALEIIDKPLCEMIIDDCGFEAKYEEHGNLVNIVEINSERTEEILGTVRQALKQINGEEK